MTSKPRKSAVSDFKRRRIIHDAGNRCSFCLQDDISILHPHHIRPVAEGGTDDCENLISACPTCHAKITVGTIPFEAVMTAKRAQPVARERAEAMPRAESVVMVHGPVNESVIAGRDVVYKITGKKRPPRAALADSLATDPNKLRFCKYLVDRYQEIKAWDVGKDQMRYAAIYAGIKREFKAPLQDIPLHRFQELTDYLQRRILNSKIGRGRNARGQGLFESFEEFLERHG